MENIIIAFASDDGKNFINRHFGDSAFYYIYRLMDYKLEFVKRISNTTEEEEGHAAPIKAGNIGALLKNEGVNVTVSKIYGPNIRRIRKKFVCILSKVSTLEEAKEKIIANKDKIIKEWEKGEDRTHLQL